MSLVRVRPRELDLTKGIINSTKPHEDMGQIIISVRNLGKIFPSGQSSIVALEHVNLDVTKNEFVSIVGPSGCGKTTLIRLIGDLIKPSSGKILVNGKSPEKARKDRDFGYVFQDPVLFPWRTVSQNIQLPKEVFNQKEESNRIKELIKLVVLSGFENSLPRELSAGMKSKVAIARALSYQPSVLLMDEPFGNIDELTRENLNAELLKIWESTKRTIVFVTHSIPEAVFLSDRIFVMTSRPGRIKSDVQVELERPRTLEMRKSSKYAMLVEEIREFLRENQ